jgi:trans-2,3-dihydro-3-hydroxyanthranilate isomerase
MMLRTGRRPAYRYRVVDVFTETPLEGNPLAVFPEAAGLDEATMQAIAKELNLSETTFVLPATRSDCAVRVRIFTPAGEMTFAGHPTVGTSFVLLDEGAVPRTTNRFALEEKVGPVPIRVDAGARPLIWFTTPPIAYGHVYDGALCARVLGLRPSDLLAASPQLLSAGNPTVFVPVKDKATVDRAWIDLAGLASLDEGGDVCVFVFTPTAEGAYSRMFARHHGIIEDPATGSSTGPLAAFMMRYQLAPSTAGRRFVSEQGVKMGRRSVLHVHVRGEHGGDGIDVGGHVTPIAEGSLRP